MTENLLKKYPKVFNEPDFQYGWPKGWNDLVHQLIEKVVAVAPENFEVLQIKEKFAGLRFYYKNGNEEINRLVNQAENESFTICQNCGSKEGKQSTSAFGWIKTLCEKCDEFK